MLSVTAACGECITTSESALQHHSQSKQTGNILPELVGHSLSQATPFQEPLTFAFKHALNCENQDPLWIEIREEESSQEIPGRTICAANTLTFVPQMTLTWKNKPTLNTAVTSWIGLRPSGKYVAKIANHAPLHFTMANLDYGLFWFGEDSTGERNFSDFPTPLRKPNAPTVVFFHGQQKGAVEGNVWRGNPFLKTIGNEDVENLLPVWKERGYNVGIFFWEQFSDETDPRAIENKLWSERLVQEKGIPFLTPPNLLSHLPSGKILADLLCDEYDRSLENLRPQHLRLVAHSTGAQLALHCAERHREVTPTFPDRIVFLDPFWSKGNKDYPRTIWTGDLSVQKLEWILRSQLVAAEQYKTSPLGGVVGDTNLPLRELTAFARIWADFIPRFSFGLHHNYSIPWYFESLKNPLPVKGGGSLGAAATNAEIRALMNSPSQSSLRHYSSVGSGNLTSSAADDAFLVKSGITTW
jgi:hypothetical protein